MIELGSVVRCSAAPADSECSGSPIRAKQQPLEQGLLFVCPADHVPAWICTQFKGSTMWAHCNS